MPDISLFCPQGHPVTRQGARFCGTCGAPLSARCNRCQTTLAADATSCEKCDAAAPAQREAAQQPIVRETQWAARTERPHKPMPLAAVLTAAAMVAGLALAGAGIWLFIGSDGGSEEVSLALGPEPKEVPPSTPSGGTSGPPGEADSGGARTPPAKSTLQPKPPAAPTEQGPSGNAIGSTSFRVPLTIEVPAGWQVSVDLENLLEVEAGKDSLYFRAAWLNIAYVADASSGPITPEDIIAEVLASSEGVFEPLAPPSPATLFGRSASAIDMRVPQDVTFTGGFLSNHEFLAGDRVHFVAGQLGTSFLLVYAEAQTGKWDSIWPVFQGMIESISPGQ